jgi:polyisoprenoid-binding protein YceI
VKKIVALIVVIYVFLSIPNLTFGLSFMIDPERSAMSFTGHSPLGSFQGKTNKINGEVLVKDDKNLNDVVASVGFDVASLKTGNGLMDEHMYNRYLESSIYPRIFFSPSSLKLIDQNHGEVSGNLTIHGVTLHVNVPITALISADSSLVVTNGNFPVSLSDFKIKKPRFLLISVDDRMHIEFSLTWVRKENRGE